MYAVALSKVFAYKCIEGRRLVEVAGGVAEPLRTGRDTLEEMLGGNREAAAQIRDPSILEWAEAELEWCNEYGIRALYIEEEEY